MLLYGPPGTGKTLIARQIGKMLNGKEPKVMLCVQGVLHAIGATVTSGQLPFGGDLGCPPPLIGQCGTGNHCSTISAGGEWTGSAFQVCGPSGREHPQPVW